MYATVKHGDRNDSAVRKVGPVNAVPHTLTDCTKPLSVVFISANQSSGVSVGEKSAFVVNVVRMLLVSFTFGNMKSLLYSLAGGILSYVVMIVLKRVKSFGMVTVSVAGGIFHNVGQILVAMAIVETTAIIWYLTVLFFTGILSGFFVGFISWMIIKKIPGNIEEF